MRWYNIKVLIIVQGRLSNKDSVSFLCKDISRELNVLITKLYGDELSVINSRNTEYTFTGSNSVFQIQNFWYQNIEEQCLKTHKAKTCIKNQSRIF